MNTREMVLAFLIVLAAVFLDAVLLATFAGSAFGQTEQAVQPPHHSFHSRLICPGGFICFPSLEDRKGGYNSRP